MSNEEVIITHPPKFLRLLLNNKKQTYKVSNKQLVEEITAQFETYQIDELCRIDKEILYKLLKKALMKHHFQVKTYKDYIEKLDRVINDLNTFISIQLNIEDYIEYENSIQIFISHSSRTDIIAQAFVELLLKHGANKSNITDIHDEEILKLLPGSNYIYPINEYIKESEVFVSIMDKNFLTSQMCNVEVGMALASDSLILPIFESKPNRKDDRLFQNHHIECLDDKRYLKKMISLMDIKPEDEHIDFFIDQLQLLRNQIDENDRKRKEYSNEQHNKK